MPATEGGSTDEQQRAGNERDEGQTRGLCTKEAEGSSCVNAQGGGAGVGDGEPGGGCVQERQGRGKGSSEPRDREVGQLPAGGGGGGRRARVTSCHSGQGGASPKFRRGPQRPPGPFPQIDGDVRLLTAPYLAPAWAPVLLTP